MPMKHVLFRQLNSTSHSLGIITLNRPAVLNAQSLQMLVQITQQLKQWANDEKIAAVIITGGGDKGFCAGGDIRHLYQHAKEAPNIGHHIFGKEYELNGLIYHYKKPFISLINGITMGGGVGMSLHGSISITTETTRWAMPETRIGFFPDAGSMYRLSRLPDYLGFYLALTGNIINASELLALKLADYHIKKEDFRHIIRELTTTPLSTDENEKIIRSIISQYHCSASNNTSDIYPNHLKTPDFNGMSSAEYKSKNFPNSGAIAQSFKSDSAQAHYVKASASSSDLGILSHRRLIAECFNQQSIEDIMQALKAYDKDHGSAFATATYQTLQKRSPLSLVMTLKALWKQSTLSFDQCQLLDKSIARFMIEQPEFFEGVRAQLIDKDQSPQWSINLSQAQILTHHFFNTM